MKYKVKTNETFQLDLEYWERTETGRDPIDLTDYDDIAIDFRKGKNTRSELIVRKELGDGISVLNNNLICETIFQEPGTVYFDIFFQDNGKWLNYGEGEIMVTENITEL